jgi:hypothetical protein
MKTVLQAVFLSLSLIAATSVHATEQSQQRQDSRDIKQDGRSEARSNKIDCKLDSNKSNSECRQDKRGAKQDNRKEARDVKY